MPSWQPDVYGATVPVTSKKLGGLRHVFSTTDAQHAVTAPGGQVLAGRAPRDAVHEAALLHLPQHSAARRVIGEEFICARKATRSTCELRDEKRRGP